MREFTDVVVKSLACSLIINDSTTEAKRKMTELYIVEWRDVIRQRDNCQKFVFGLKVLHEMKVKLVVVFFKLAQLLFMCDYIDKISLYVIMLTQLPFMCDYADNYCLCVIMLTQLLFMGDYVDTITVYV
jgi:hypothetical protein